MRPLGMLAAATLAVGSLAGYFALERRLVSPDPGPPPNASSRPSAPAAVTAPDPGSLRDVFRFGDRLAAEAAVDGVPETRVDPVARLAPAEPPGPRLVGLVRRSGRLLAAFAVDGSIELAAEGDSIAGLTVLAIGDDGVRVRRGQDGSEATLLY